MTVLFLTRKLRNIAALVLLSFSLASCSTLSSLDIGGRVSDLGGKIGDFGGKVGSKVGLGGKSSNADRAEFEGPSSEEDADSDGVADAFDKCPNTVLGFPVGEDGCDDFSGPLVGVSFESGSDKLTESSKKNLAEIAKGLAEFPGVRVAIAAHTDNQGPAAGNLQLSKRRAITVARYFVELGLPGNRLQPQAYGESQPLTSNSTAEGRAINRRIELQLLR